MKKLIVANWKANPATAAEAEDILAATDEWLSNVKDAPSLVICPPFVYLQEVAERLQEGRLAAAAVLGAQDIAATDDRAQTGEVSGAQLIALGVRYVIVGHSERRYKLGESDETVHAKLLAALRHGITPILCVGERARDGDWKDGLARQVRAGIEGLDGPDLARVIIAYEPVWAISTNEGARADTPESAASAAGVIGGASRLLYGGSVTPANAKSFLAVGAFSGVLVGGASVRAADFTAILSQSL
jgi:triosephosphate isomerase